MRSKKFTKTKNKGKQRKQRRKARYRRNAFMNESQEAAKNKATKRGKSTAEIQSHPHPIPSHSIYVIPVICLLFIIYFKNYLLFIYSVIPLITYIQIENLTLT
jgi:hypothetical protein